MVMLKVSIFAMLLTGIIFSSCSSKKYTPESVAVEFYDLLYNEHNLEKASALVTDASKEKLSNDFKFIEGALQIIEASEPTKYIYRVDESKSVIKNDSAFIHVWSSLDSTSMQTLLLNINNSWFVDFNYTIPVDAFNEELIKEVLTEMEQYVDTVKIDN